MTTPAPVPNVGDLVYLSQAMAKLLFYGVVTSPDSPDQFAASMELVGDQGVVTMPVLTGKRGPAGQPCFALRLQADISVNDVSELPQHLANTEVDIGKYYVIDDLDADGLVIGSSAYVWFGRAWRRLQMGTPGPPGPLPIITPSVELVDPNKEVSTVVTSGSSYEPSWHLKLAVPQGPPGPSATINSAPDTDFQTRPPRPGDVLGFTGKRTPGGDPLWIPVSISALIPAPFSVPETAFQDLPNIGVGAGSGGVQIGQFSIPPQAFPWTPIVWGHFKAKGLELDPTPMLIGCEVNLGSPTSGTLVGRGWGNSNGEINIMPHYSSPQDGAAAIAPGNGRAVVPANHLDPALGTVYVRLRSDGGAGGIYGFDRKNAQLFIMVVPINQDESFDEQD